MKKYKFQYLIPVIISILFLGLYSSGEVKTNRSVIKQQVVFDPNNISTFIWNTGVFNQDLRTNTAGFQWPKGSGKLAIFTTGLCIGAKFNNELRMGNASYSGEYAPGYCVNGQFYTDIIFKLYSVKPTDNYITNPDWLLWGNMVPYGAPYVDVNHNGTYEYMIDTPGVKGAAQTVFVSISDADSSNHTVSEGFSGGTKPIGAEVHLTAWGYNLTGLQDIQFFKWVVINKHVYQWDSTFFSIVCDPDLGEALDDYVGCDTVREMGYVYNMDNMDGNGMGTSYGANPPAVGFVFLKSAENKSVLPHMNLGMTSYIFFHGPAAWSAICEIDPSSIWHSYNYMRGIKRDGTIWLCPLFNPPKRTKHTYSGEPEPNQGWTEFQGMIDNCGGDTTGNYIVPSPAGEVRFVMSSGAGNFIVSPGDTQTIVAAQFIARGTSNLNSVTKLKQLADVAIQLCNNGFVIGVKPISSEVPQHFELYQNYPNPFNPITKIKFSIPPVRQRHAFDVRLVIYDILGREVSVLVNEELKPGTYEVEWNASNYPSGVYFYKLISGVYSETRKMVLIK